MTDLKIAGKPTAAAVTAISPHVDAIYRAPGTRRVFIGELQHTERMEPAPDEDKVRTVTCRITSLEFPNAEQEELVRQAQRALYLQRTARGTLTEDGDVELADETLRQTGGQLFAIEVSRMHVAVQHWQRYVTRLRDNGRLTNSELRHELATIADGLQAVLNATDGEG